MLTDQLRPVDEQHSTPSDTLRATCALAIVIPARNEAGMLAQTLPALREALAAFPHPWRIYLVDDASSDDTAAIARSHGLEVIAGEARGPGAARNLGVRSAMPWLQQQTSEQHGWLLFLDADCRLSRDFFARTADLLGHSELALITVQERPVFSHWHKKAFNWLKRVQQAWLASHLDLPIVHAGCLYVRAQSFLAAGGFSSEHLFEDIEFGFRFARGEIQVVRAPIVAEVSERRLQRVGRLASWVMPARFSAILILQRFFSRSPWRDRVQRALQGAQPVSLPVGLWWHDPEGRLHCNLLDAVRVYGLLVMILLVLRLRPQPAKAKARSYSRATLIQS